MLFYLSRFLVVFLLWQSAAVWAAQSWVFEKGHLIVTSEPVSPASYQAWEQPVDGNALLVASERGIRVMTLDGQVGAVVETDYVRQFSNGLALVERYAPGGDYYGFVDATGKVVVPMRYRRAMSFSEGLAGVCEIRKKATSKTNAVYRCGYIDVSGRAVIPIQDRIVDIESFSNGLAAVNVLTGNKRVTISLDGVGEQDESLQGFVDKTGKLVIPPKFGWNPGHIGDARFADGFAPVTQDSQDNRGCCMTYVDRDGAEHGLYVEARPFVHGLAWVTQRPVAPGERAKDQLINRDGTPVGPAINGFISSVSDTQFQLCRNGVRVASEQCARIGLDGKMIVDFDARPTEPHAKPGNERYRTLQGNRVGYKDEHGVWVIQAQYADASPFNEDGYALVQDESGWSVIDRQGAIVTGGYKKATMYGNIILITK